MQLLPAPMYHPYLFLHHVVPVELWVAIDLPSIVCGILKLLVKLSPVCRGVDRQHLDLECPLPHHHVVPIHHQLFWYTATNHTSVRTDVFTSGG